MRRGSHPRIFACYWALILVGIGSTAFHGTLMFEAQMLDEIPMIWANGVFLYAISHKHRETHPKLTLLACFSYSFVSSLLYMTIFVNYASFHEVAYALGVFYMAYICVDICRHEYPEAKYLRTTLAHGVIAAAAAFTLWNIDNTICAHLEWSREHLHLNGLWFLTPLTQFHAWWHFLSAISSYKLIVFLEMVDTLNRGKKGKNFPTCFRVVDQWEDVHMD